MCHQTVALVQRALDDEGCATVSLSVLEEITRRCTPSRALCVDHPLGAPLGPPGDRAVHRGVVLEALALLEREDYPVIATLSRRD
jgi:D-proline reductase (dithiol) PrdB